MSVIAGGMPLYGIICMSPLIIDANSEPDTHEPDEPWPKRTLPGLAFT